MAKIERDAKAAKNSEDSTRQRCANGDHEQIHAAVNELAEFTIRMHARQPTQNVSTPKMYSQKAKSFDL